MYLSSSTAVSVPATYLNPQVVHKQHLQSREWPVKDSYSSTCAQIFTFVKLGRVGPRVRINGHLACYGICLACPIGSSRKRRSEILLASGLRVFPPVAFSIIGRVGGATHLGIRNDRFHRMLLGEIPIVNEVKYFHRRTSERQPMMEILVLYGVVRPAMWRERFSAPAELKKKKKTFCCHHRRPKRV